MKFFRDINYNDTYNKHQIAVNLVLPKEKNMPYIVKLQTMRSHA